MGHTRTATAPTRIVRGVSKPDGADYAEALRAYMLGSATDEQFQLLEAVRIDAGYPSGRYPWPPTDESAPVYTDPADSGGSPPKGDVGVSIPRRSRCIVPLADEVAECGQHPARSVRNRHE